MILLRMNLIQEVHCMNDKVVEFDHFKAEAGLHTFTLSAKEWIEKTNAIGMYPLQN